MAGESGMLSENSMGQLTQYTGWTRESSRGLPSVCVWVLVSSFYTHTTHIGLESILYDLILA